MDPGWELILNLFGRVSPWGLVTAFVLAIFMGRLVPRSTLDDVRQDRTDRIAEIASERDDWKAAYTTSEDTRRVLAGQVADLMEVAKTTDAFIRGLKRGDG